MIKLKKIITLLLALALLLPMAVLTPAAEDEKWMFIDGENITRALNTAIVYRNIASTGQSQWGFDVVVDASGYVTEIIEGGLPEGENLAVPEGGMVISASGSKTNWLRSNLSVGSKVFYDAPNQKLFLCNSIGTFDPYFTRIAEVNGSDGEYLITNPSVKGTPAYKYSVAVDAKGFVSMRGSDIVAPEGGFLVSASTKSDMQFLIMYAPLGAKCTVNSGIVSFGYNQTMHTRTAETALLNAEALIYNAKMSFADVDFASLDASVSEISNLINGSLTYEKLTEILVRIENEITSVCHDREISELRGAYHTPREKDINQVRATVKRAKENGLNSILLRVSNGYGTIIPLPEDNRFKQDSYFGGFDVLKAYITVCEEEDISLTLAIDVFYNESAFLAAPEWLTKTNKGESKITNRFYSPASAEFAEYYLDYISYIVNEYDVKSIVFDSLRYPRFSEDCDFGYDDNTLNDFASAYGISFKEASEIKTKLFDSPHWQSWVEYRVGLVTNMAKTISDTVRNLRPDVTLLAVTARDSVDYFYSQDAICWIQEGIFDGLCLELYERDRDENDPLDPLSYSDSAVVHKGALFGAYTAKEKFYFVGLESSASVSHAEMERAVTDSRSIGADGFMFSDLDSFANGNYASRLQKGAMYGEAISPLSETDKAIRRLLEYSKTKINDCVLAFGGCDEETAQNALSKINEAIFNIDKGEKTSYQTAKTLESDIAMILAASSAKLSVLKEFEAITKLALLHKEPKSDIPETEDPPITDESGSEESEISGTDESHPEESENESLTEDESEESGEKIPFGETGSGISFANLLIYTFVGIALIASLIAFTVGIRRKNKREPNSHMPRSAAKEREQGGNEE